MDWPYDETETPIAEPNAPEWECPEGICECHHPDDTGEKYEFSVMLFSPEGERMKNARCRILHHGRVINEDQPNADDSGWVTAMVPRLPATVLVEWAPKEMPRRPPYPFRKWYYVNVEDDKNESARRRLHNLGYSRFHSLVENIKSFQRDNGEEHPSGKVEDIEGDLFDYHDDGRYPYRPLDGKGGGSGDDIVAGPGQQKAKAPPSGDKPSKPVKQPPAPSAPTKGAKKIGYGALVFPDHLPTVVEALKKDEGLYEFVHIVSTAKTSTKQDIFGIFWIFGEALMWKVKSSDPWNKWQRSYSPLPNKPRIGTLTNDERERLCRLPCSATESQEATDWVKMTQQELRSTFQDATLYPPDRKEALPCLLPTTKLYDLLYQQADVRIEYVYVGDMDHRSLANMSNEYNDRVNARIRDAMKAASKTTIKSVGTPGKIWAIHQDMDIWAQKGNPPPPTPYVAAVNYGFHTKGPPAKAFQGADVWHPLSHKDYSQILVLVAGWCLVAQPGEDYKWKKTSEVYLDSELCRLVMTDNLPAPELKYTGIGRGDKNNPKKSPPKKADPAP